MEAITTWQIATLRLSRGTVTHHSMQRWPRSLIEDPACSRRPMLLEEFGHAGWNPVRHYDAMAHAALAAGAAGAMSYEWGVRWLAPELSYQSLPLRDVLHVAADPRFFAPLPDLVKDWPAKSTGIDPSPSGFTYGSIYTGTPFPARLRLLLAN